MQSSIPLSWCWCKHTQDYLLHTKLKFHQKEIKLQVFPLIDTQF